MIGLKNKMAQGGALAVLMLVIMSSSIALVNESSIGDLDGYLSLEKEIEIDIWADTNLSIVSDNENITSVLLTLENGTAIENQEIEIYINSSLISVEKTNKSGMAEFTFTPYKAGGGRRTQKR